MKQSIPVRPKTLRDIAIPCVTGSVDGHVDGHGRAKNGAAWNATPVTTVVGIAAVVAHHKVLIFRNGYRHSPERREQFIVRRNFRRTGRIGLLQLRAVDPDGTVANVDLVAGQADDALDEIRLVWLTVGRLEDDDLLALGFAPQGNVNIGERDAGIVADATHDEMIADEQRVFHGA